MSNVLISCSCKLPSSPLTRSLLRSETGMLDCSLVAVIEPSVTTVLDQRALVVYQRGGLCAARCHVQPGLAMFNVLSTFRQTHALTSECTVLFCRRYAVTLSLARKE